MAKKTRQREFLIRLFNWDPNQIEE